MMGNNSIVILTGAGISKESGLDTFRDEDGLWSQVRIEDVATPEAYERDPGHVLEFYNARRHSMRRENVRPNAAHVALAQLEKTWPNEVLVVTQNIDNLHEQAGSQNILHMHGEILKARCAACENVFVWEESIYLDDICQACGDIGRIRPHIVWFGEVPFFMEEIYLAVERCRLFISIGTSGSVYPAAGLVQHARMRGFGHTVELNLKASEGATEFAETHYGYASEIVPSYVEKLLTNGLDA